MEDALPNPKEISRNKKLKHKTRRQMPMDFKLELPNDDHIEIALLEQQITALYAEEDPNLRHLVGKYERYYYDEAHKTIVKEIMVLHADGKVLVRANSGIYKGIASYFMNAVLTVNLYAINDRQVFCSQMMSYVGRHKYEDIEVLYSITNTINDDNLPIARHEVLIPMHQHTALPEIIRIETLSYFKLDKKYPHLVRHIQSRSMKSLSKVHWE